MQVGVNLRHGYLDTLRFVAASLVVMQHLFERQAGFWTEVFIRLGPGVAGVALFFFISGFAIPMSMRGELDWWRFMVRRLFRIYPLYLAALGLIFVSAVLALVPNWIDMPGASPGRWIANLLLVQDFVRVKAFLGVSWTLAIELIWYALFAIVISALGSRAAGVLDVAIPLGLLALALVSLVAGQRIPLARPTMVYAAVIGFQCFRHASGELPTRALIGSVLRFAIVALVCDLVSFGMFSHRSISLAQAVGPWTVGTVIFLTVLFVPRLRDHRWLNRGVMPWLGARSYSIYLLHPLTIALATRFASGPVRVAAALTLTVGLSALTFRLIEQPGIALGRRIAAGAPRLRAAEVG